jgi:hypothetical protein
LGWHQILACYVAQHASINLTWAANMRPEMAEMTTSILCSFQGLSQCDFILVRHDKEPHRRNAVEHSRGLLSLEIVADQRDSTRDLSSDYENLVLL